MINGWLVVTLSSNQLPKIKENNLKCNTDEDKCPISVHFISHLPTGIKKNGLNGTQTKMNFDHWFLFD